MRLIYLHRNGWDTSRPQIPTAPKAESGPENETQFRLIIHGYLARECNPFICSPRALSPRLGRRHRTKFIAFSLF